MDRDKIYDNDVLDYYGSLLTARQREVMGLYVNDDLSMGEIAEMLAISKPAVADLIKRCYRQLDAYEEHLCLISRERQREAIYREMLEELPEEEARSFVDRLKELR